MPAQIVIALNDITLANRVATELSARGYDTIAFSDPMAALNELEDARRLQLLIASVDFGAGRPNGVTLARMAKLKRPRMMAIFLGLPEMLVHTEGLGKLLLPSVTAPDVVAQVAGMLKAALPAREA